MKSRPIIKRNCHLIPIRRLKIGEICQEGDYFGSMRETNYDTRNANLIPIPSRGYFHIGRIINGNEEAEMFWWAYRKMES